MPAGGAVRLASDSHPAAGRSMQPDEKRFKLSLLILMTIDRLELFERSSPCFSGDFPQ